MKDKKIIREIFWTAGIILYSILFFAVLISKKINCLYADDNIMQWGVVSDKAFDQIFSGQGLPYWNFYQYKGIDILSSGYYGLLNPFMYLAYMISRFVFSSVLDMLTVYMCLLYSLGNLMMYRLMREINLKTGVIAVSLLAYSTTMIFFSYAYYYFTFNNYFFIPFLIWIMLNTRSDRSRWFVPGIILAFLFLLGHAQYSCYYIIVYVIIQVVFSVQEKKWKSLLPIASNMTVFAGLSFCLLILSVSVSKDRSLIFEGQTTDFLNSDIPVLNNFIPLNIFIFTNSDQDLFYLFNDNVGLGVFSWLNIIFLVPLLKSVTDIGNKAETKIAEKNKILDIIFKYISCSLLLIIDFVFLLNPIINFIGAFTGIYVSQTEYILYSIEIGALSVGVFISIVLKLHFMISQKLRNVALLLTLVVLLIKLPFFTYIILIVYYIMKCVKGNRIGRCTGAERCIHAILFAAVFFMIFAAGKDGTLALLLEKLPVFNSFRYLYKCSFIYVPIIILTGAYAMNKMNIKAAKAVGTVSVLLSVIAVANIIFIAWSGHHPYINNSYFDYFNYRQIEEEVNSLMEENKIDKNYRFLNFGMDGSQCNEVEYSSKICVYALTKNYATAYNCFSLNGYDNIFSMKNFNQSNKIMWNPSSEGMMSNIVSDIYKIQEYTEDENDIREFEEQMINNGVKYVFVSDKFTETYDIFKEIIDACDKLSIKRTIPWCYDLTLIELDGVRPISSYDANQKLNMETALDMIRFDTSFEKATDITIEMTYDPHYHIRLYDADGNLSEIIPEEDPDGYVTATIPKGNYTVELRYQNRMMDVAVVFSVLTLILTAASVFVILRRKMKTGITDKSCKEISDKKLLN